MLDGIATAPHTQPSAPTRGIPARLPKRGKKSDLAPDEYLKKHGETIKKLNESEDERARLYTTIAKRQRGGKHNISEAIGAFSLDGRRWIDVEMSNIRVINIIEPAIKANTTTQSQANVVIDIKPATSARKGAASVADGIYAYLENKDWTEQLEFFVCERPQVSAAVFLRAYYDATCDDSKKSVPDFIDTEMSGTGTFVCGHCGASGEMTGDDLDAKGVYICPDCGEPAEIDDQPENSFVPVPNWREESQGASRTETASAYEIRMDLQGTSGGAFERGQYFEYHPLKTRDYLEDKYPHFELGTPNEPSYPLKWQHALQTGLKTVRDGEWTQKGVETGADLFEERNIYLRPSKYKSYRAPEYFALRDAETNEVVWDMQIGESFPDAIRRQSKKKSKREPRGIKFTLINDRLACAPEFADFAEEWSIIQFAPDAFSAWGRPFSIILSVQADINELNTIMMLHLNKNSIANVVVDTTMFDFEDFEQDFVPTREGVSINDNIRNHFAVVDPPRLGGEPVGYLQFLLSFSNNLTGVQPAAVGQAQPGTPFHAQLLQVNQSQGLLATFGKSKAQGKCSWIKNHLRIAQDEWSEEQFENIRTQYGSEWKDEDLEDFYHCNIDTDLLVSYIEGSEVPKTLMQREIKLQNFIQQVTQMAAIPNAVTPQTFQQLIAQLADYSDVDLDVGNYEGENRLAQARYERLEQGCEAFMMQGYAVPMDEQGQTQVVMRIISQGRCTPNPRAENHNIQKEFWADKIRALESSDDDNELLIACCNMMWQMADEATVILAQLNAENSIKAQAPIEQHQQEIQNQQMAQQQQMQGQQNQLLAAQSQQEQASEQQKQQAEDERTQAMLADSQANRQQADTHKAADLIDAQAEREHQMELARMQDQPPDGDN